MNTNPFQNPWVVAGLALAAGGSLYYQLNVRTKLTKAKPMVAGVPVASVAGVSAEHPVGAIKTGAVAVPVELSWGVDLDYVNQRYRKWTESPNRDPFGVQLKAIPAMHANITNVSDVLRVAAIWRQTGQRLAVINNQVVMEGAELEGFRIEKIEADVIRVSSPRGAEEIRMAEFDPDAVTNATASSQDPASGPPSPGQ